MKSFLHGLVYSLMLVSLLSCSNSKTTLNESNSSDEILFVSNQDGNREIYTVKLDGTSLVRLTDNKGDDYEASWSPDGQKIVYTSNRKKGSAEVIIMAANGSGQINISNSAGFDGRAQWSPDGKTIAFNSARNGLEQIYLYDLASQKTSQLTNNEFAAVQPVWSPDGKWIAYQNLGKANKPDVWLISVDGNNKFKLTDNQKFEDNSLSWSPDGSKILYHSRRSYQHNIFVYDIEQKKESQLTQLGTLDVDPKWSLDGSQILFLSTRGQFGRTQLCMMKSDGTEQKCITDSRYQVADAQWLDNRSILHSNWHGKRFSNIYLLELDTEKLKVLSPAVGYQSNPMPRPNRLPNKSSLTAKLADVFSGIWRNS